MSGTDLLVRPSPLSEDNYQSVLSCLDLNSKSVNEQISSLTTMPAMNLLSIPPTVHFGPVVDSEVVHSSPSYTSISNSEPRLPATSWLDSLMIGDTAYDGSILFLALGGRSNIASSFHSSITKTLGADVYSKISQIYGLKPEITDKQAQPLIQRFGNDVAFFAPTLAYAKHFSTAGIKTHVYRFNATNPWDGPLKGTANHILDIAFLFHNYNQFLSETHRKVAEGFAEKVLGFVAGKEPCKTWKQGGEALIVGDDKVIVGSDQEPGNGRREEFRKLAEEVGWQKLEDTWGAFVSGK